MKKSFSLMMLFVLSLGFFTACEDDDKETPETVTGCEISKNVADNYREDAIRLALRLQQQGVAAGEIQIPEALINRMLGAISAIVDEKFNFSSEFIARDSVIEMYDIHALDYPAFDEFTLQVDTSEAWVKNWVDGSRLTGNTDIDNLMNIYGLDLESVNSFEGEGETFTFVVITSQNPLNLAGLVEKFETVDGVTSGSFDDAGGDGNDITVVDNGSFLELTFTVGYDSPANVGECTGACDFSRSWVFNVADSDDDCTATYENSFGDEAP